MYRNFWTATRAPDKDRFLFSRNAISSPNPMFDHSLETSHRDDSNKWSNKGFGEESTQVESIEVNLTLCMLGNFFKYLFL